MKVHGVMVPAIRGIFAWALNVCRCLQPCPCTLEDLYCEYGFEKLSNDSSKCGSLLMGYAPVCSAIAQGRYKTAKSHMRLPRHGVCENLASLIPDSDGQVCIASVF